MYGRIVDATDSQLGYDPPQPWGHATRAPDFLSGRASAEGEIPMKKTALAVSTILLLVSGCIHFSDRRTVAAPDPGATAARASVVAPAPRNIILIVSDGFGFSHLTTANLILGDAFRLRTVPVVGIVQTRSADSLLTDSAGAASAMATGYKTNNRVISIDPSGTARPTVLQRAEKLGKATGVITTTGFWDATPAAFAAHSPSRYEAEDIATQMLGAGMEFIAGTGIENFGVEARKRVEDVASMFRYDLVRTRAELEAATGERTLVVLPETVNDVESSEIPLAVLAGKAIDLLSRDADGFFLLIENEGTDSASHSNATEDVLSSIRSLNRTAGVALDWAARNGDTLVIVTSDHETGGMQLYTNAAGQLEIRWGTKGHTGGDVPLLAWGPGSEAFAGILDNTDIAKKIFGFWGR